MSTRPCGNCKKTVYVNEKMDAEGRWYHRPCFKCMAPNCGTSLTMRTFQMAALDESVIDELTRRPLKVLVCKEHVPMPKATISSDSLSLKHSTSAPKPAMAGLHRSLMGDRSKDGQAEEGEHTPTKAYSPRSLDQGSHANFLKGGLTKEQKDAPLSVSTAATSLTSSKSHDALHSGGSSANAHTPKSAESEVRSMLTTTLPKFRGGRFTVAPSSATADSMAVSHTAAENAQDPTKDDDSFRTIPIRHRDYGHTEGDLEEEDNKQERTFTMKTSHNNKHSSHDIYNEDLLDPHAELRDVDVSLETVEDVSKHIDHDHIHINLKDAHAVDEAEVKAPHDEKEDDKLVSMAFQSKLMDQHSKKDDAEVDDDEWDATPADDYSRRDTVAGM
ncbi:hypothetical protein KI688_008329 [Linnemannia hyalina]|uniref:LIM zinc-binding domain-containing protein n=1 Tax=Linnemannia hyalina TaxID=64524 RepID=A0A9P7Y051_9FUNG|nr:hypothetical protein KI688_008329 [Linnemannia hyalina]